MVFIFKAVFWTAVVLVFMPGISLGTASTPDAPALETVRSDVLVTLARVRTDLHARDFQAR